MQRTVRGTNRGYASFSRSIGRRAGSGCSYTKLHVRNMKPQRVSSNQNKQDTISRFENFDTASRAAKWRLSANTLHKFLNGPNTPTTYSSNVAFHTTPHRVRR